MASNSNSEGFASNIAPLFNGTNYQYWKVRMQIYLRSLGYDVWTVVVNGYTPPTTTLTTLEQKKELENGSKAQNALMCVLVDNEMTKVMTCTSTKEIWDKLKSIHEGDVKIKEAKLQTHRAMFEGLKMNGDKSIEEYMHRVNETVNSIWGLGEKIENSIIVKKVLRSLTEKYNSKFFAIEEAKDMNTFSMDELHGSLTVYEMRIAKEKPSDKEAAFKAKQIAKEKPKLDSDEVLDALEAQFVRKLKKGGRGKYQGKLPFKCFKCGRVGHFAIKCPYGEKDKEDEESHKEKRNWKKKSHFKSNNYKR